MEMYQWWPLIAFAFVSTFSPGPNNIMLMTSGANVGFIKTVPHMLGVTIGFSVMILAVGIGLTGVFQTYPIVQDVLHWLCLSYLIYLAIKIALSKPSDKDESYRPMSFISAAMFQWVNPKGWSMALTAVSVYNASASWFGLSIIAITFAMVNVPSVSIWTAAGKQLSSVMNNPKYVRWFNGSMGGLLLLSAVPTL